MTHMIIQVLAPIFFVLALGYAAGRLRIVDNRQVGSFNKLVMNFALPASLLVATASASRTEMLGQAPLFAVLGSGMLIVYFGWFLISRAFLNTSKTDASLQALTISFPNLAGVGLPIASSVLGSAGAVPVAVALATGSILVTPLGLLIVEMNTAGKAKSSSATSQILAAISHAFTKPVVIAPALGILLSLTDLRLNPIVDASLVLIGSAAAGVALFLTGLILSAQALQLNWKIIAATGVSDIVRPALTAAIVFALPISSDAAKAAILLAAVPSGFFGILFAVDYRLDPATMGSMVAASTLFSIVTMTIVIAMLFSH